MFRSTLIRAMLVLGLIASPPVARAEAKVSDDALARPEFGKELSIDFKAMDIVSFFRMFSKMTLVPFVIDFESDPGLRISSKAENMVARGILASVASTYGLEFASSEEGIVVRRPGFPPASTRTTVGAWPVRLGQSYLMEMTVRNPAGEVVAMPRLILQMGVTGSAKVGVGFKGRQVLMFDRTRNLIEPHHVGDIELAFSISGETGGGLDLLLELVVSKALSGDSYSKEHTVIQRHADPGETLLAKASDGHEFVLTRWTRRPTPENREP